MTKKQRLAQKTSKPQGLYVQLRVEGIIQKKKAAASVILDEGYLLPLLVINMAGPDRQGVTYTTLDALRASPKRARRRLLQSCNLAVPVEKMSELVKAYPKSIGKRKCHGVIDTNLSSQRLGTMQRTASVRVNKGFAKMRIGNSFQDAAVIDARVAEIRRVLQGEGYAVTRVLVGGTQSGLRR